MELEIQINIQQQGCLQDIKASCAHCGNVLYLKIEAMASEMNIS
jgi:hypothetical protein